MALLPVLFDPVAEGTGSELDINDGAPGRSGYVVEAPIDMPPPAVKSIYADSASTEGAIPVEGEPKYDNRQIGLKIHVYGTSAADLQDNLTALYQKFGKLHREGGTLSITTAAEIECIFDLLPESGGPTTFDERYLRRNHVLVELTLTAKPFWRGQEIDLGTESETTLPALVFEVSDVPGDVPALGRLVVRDLSGNDQWQVDVGVQSRYYDGAATAALFYQAEDLTPFGTSTKVAGAAGASGPGANKVVRNTDLVPTYQAVLRSEIDATNAALTHKGSFRLKARIYRPTGNTGNVAVRLEWAEGDYRRPTLNDPVSFGSDDREGVFLWVDLGLVHISPNASRWEFRVLAKSTVAGDELDVDCICLFPTTEGYIELSATQQLETPSLFSARDEFTGLAVGAALNGRVAVIGGSWATSGAAGDWVGHAGFPLDGVTDMVARSATGTRFATIGSTTYTACAVSVGKVFALFGTATERIGVLARFVDANNYLAFSLGASVVELKVVVGGVSAVLKSRPNPFFSSGYTQLVATADTRGEVVGYLYDGLTGALVDTLTSWHSALATGGALASGKVGLVDVGHASGGTHLYDEVLAWVPSTDAAIFANRSLELRHDGADRADAAGSFLVPVSSPRGRFLRIPPAGAEGRSTRLIVKGYRNEPSSMADPAIDDIQAQLFVTPRGLAVPAT